MKDTLIISDTHFPYQHRDTFRFLRAAKDAYGFTQAKHTGDMVDHHSASYHEIEYGTYDAKREHDMACKAIHQLEEIFPKLDVVIGNHDRLPKRKAKSIGIPYDALKGYNDLYDVKWEWKDKFYFPVNKYANCLLTHGMSTNTRTNAEKHSHHSIQGHFHSKFGIEYYADTEVLRWSMTVGCLVDQDSPAFNYASGGTMNKSIIGCGGIIDDQPILIPMQLKKSGRWDGKI